MILLSTYNAFKATCQKAVNRGVKRALLIGAWFAVCAYACISGIWGSRGVYATRYAQSCVREISEHIDSLRRMNEEYDARWNALRSDAAAIAVEGRNLGYLKADEVALRLSPGVQAEPPRNPGSRVVYMPMEYVPDQDAKILASSIGIVASMAALIREAFRKRRRELRA